MGKISDATRIGAGPPLGGMRYDRGEILNHLIEAIKRLRFEANDKGRLVRGCKDLVDALDRCNGQTLQERWTSFEETIWPKWRAGEDRNPTHRWMWGVRVIVMARFVRPSWEWIAWVHMPRWVARLPAGDPLLDQHDRLAKAVGLITWAGPLVQLRAVTNGLRMLLVRGYASLSELTEEDLKAIPPQSTGTDVLDAALCSLGVFNRTPQRGPTRRHRRSRHTIAHLVAMADIAEPFRSVTELYMEVYSTRISDIYNTQRQKGERAGPLLAFYRSSIPRNHQFRRGAPPAWTRIYPLRHRASSRNWARRRSGRIQGTYHSACLASQRARILCRHLHLGNRARFSVRSLCASRRAFGQA